jgi:hypothetical protein
MHNLAILESYRPLKIDNPLAIPQQQIVNSGNHNHDDDDDGLMLQNDVKLYHVLLD